MTEMKDKYNPIEIESKWYQLWENSGYFKAGNIANAQSFSILLPPPNVTGNLHMGHGFQHTIIDILTRYYRMKKYNVLWQPGTDHAGIATQMVVERQLNSQGITKEELGREEFINKVWEWKNTSGGTIKSQMKILGCSCDWSRDKFTMDEEISQTVKDVFIKLYQDGLIYKKEKLVNWDIQLQTAISDLEVQNIEEHAKLWYIKYPIKNDNAYLIIATTRPETILGDVAIAVNPEDERYKDLIGKSVIVPIQNREVPIIADLYVDKSFGSGCVKITPAHDFNDYEIAIRHNLPFINILTADGKINSNAPKRFLGLSIDEARKLILSEIEDLNLLHQVKEHLLNVPRADRTNQIVQPYLTDQWFLKMDKFAIEGLKAVKNKDVSFIPDNWENVYNQWLENIHDWCISRQLWWGHQIPVYYDKHGNHYVAKSIDEARKISGINDLVQETDVLDTWFSSALWPFAALDWPNSKLIDKYLPSSVLVTGFDIIFFWVARMIMLTQKFVNKVPFKNVYIHGIIQDNHGNKMSKSKGNVIDPLDLINGITLEQLIIKRTHGLMNHKQADSIAIQTAKDFPDGFQAFGSDALRFTFALIATNTREIRFDIRKLQESKNFCNKIFNVAKFVLLNTNEITINNLNIDYSKLNFIDTWILYKLKNLILTLENAYQSYRFDVISSKLYEFIWSDFCDWYIEFSKVSLKDINKDNVAKILLYVVDIFLKLLHPIMPFITEELWQIINHKFPRGADKSIMICDYPRIDDININNVQQQIIEVELLQNFISGIRNIRNENNVNPSLLVNMVIETNKSMCVIKQFEPYLKVLCKLSHIKYSDTIDSINYTGMLKGIKYYLEIPVDKEKEQLRIKKEIEKLTSDIEKINQQLTNTNFLSRAPSNIIEKNKLLLLEYTTILNNLTTQLTKLN